MKKKEVYIKNTSKLWNSFNYVKKYNNFKYSKNDGNTSYLIERRDSVLKYIDSLNLENNSVFLELGYGAGQNASYFIKRCNKFLGIDISIPLAKFASSKNKSAVKSGKAKFIVGSMDKKFKLKSNTVNVVIIVGALQYVVNPDFCLRECKRVLKNNGHLIISQTNTFQINEMINPRKLLYNLIKFLINEHHQYSHSDTIKSLLLETKLKKYFLKYKNSWLMNSWLFLYGWNDKWKFQTNRRLLSYSRLENIIKKNGFKIIKACGQSFFYNNKNIISKLIFPIFNFILSGLNKISLFSYFLKYITASHTFLSKKK
jgi:ubiquinone/menaquinone biosynthesis C-methylase UbiE